MAGGRRLAAGFDSEPLRQLAGLRSRETEAALALMPEALRSIGFDPAASDEEFAARCQVALDIVQQDLDATGYGHYRVRAYRDRGSPVAMFAALPDGSYRTGAWGMTRRMDDAACSSLRPHRSLARSKKCDRSSGRSAPSTAAIP